MNPAALLSDLIAIPSVSAQSNIPVIRYAQRVLDAIHFQYRELAYAEGKLNLIAWPKSRGYEQGHFDLALVCHTDTVPYDWPEAVKPTIRGDRLHGRGACDVKGFLACCLAALEGSPGDVCLILTADEEVGCLGAKSLAASRVVHPRRAIVGEPTSLHPVRAGKGYCLAELVLRGREAHSAFPALGESAIYAAVPVLEQLRALERELATDRDDAFDPPYTTLNAGLISGGRAKNIVPGQCRITVEWRPIPTQPASFVAGRLQQLPCEVTVLRQDAGFTTPANSALLTEVETLAGRPAVTVSFGTEAPWIAKLGAEVIVFGPGDMRVAHSREEHVPVTELERATEVLRAVIRPAGPLRTNAGPAESPPPNRRGA